VDNLFVFTIIMSTYAVPREHQQRVLLIGIVMALGRGIFIALGAAAINTPPSPACGAPGARRLPRGRRNTLL
jgi:predicted tellurium resistance membrane protein TerC